MSVKVTVVIPAYNAAKSIDRTIVSILNQTFTSYEIIVVDDGSTDNTADYLKSNFPSVRVIRQINGGPSKARNTGIQNAQGEYIAFLDADDYWEKEKLEQQVSKLEASPECVWAFSAFYKLRDGVKIPSQIYSDYNGEDCLDLIVAGIPVHTSTVVVKRSVFKEKTFLFNEGFSNSEDREVWYKLACRYPGAAYVPTPLSCYTLDSIGSLTRNVNRKINFSFLSIEHRINEELQRTEAQRRIKLRNFIVRFNKKALVQFWSSSEDKELRRHLAEKMPWLFALLLSPLYRAPVVIKKAISRMVLRFL